MLTVRQRGRYFYVRGTVRAGGKKVYVEERPTGETRLAEAEAYRDRLSADLQEELRGGRPAIAKRLTFAEAGARLLDQRALNANDLQLLGVLNDHFGDACLLDIDASSWARFVRDALPGRAPATIDRHLYMLRAAFRAVADEGIPTPRIATPRTAQAKRRTRRVRWLPQVQADRLEAAYGRAWKGRDGKTSRAIAATLRYQGPRVQEALQIDRRHVLLGEGPHGSLFIPESKNGLARTVALHPRTRVAILPLMAERRPTFLVPGERRDFDPLFLNRYGQPYTDTRGQGGNPLSKKHATACARAGIRDFTVHDWRRHWACWCLREGVDPWTLMKLGGWTDYESVSHYVEAVTRDLDHMGEAVAKVA